MESTSEPWVAIWTLIAFQAFTSGLMAAATVASWKSLGKFRILLSVSQAFFLGMLALAIPRLADPVGQLVQFVGIWVGSYVVFLWLFKKLPEQQDTAPDVSDPPPT